MLGELEDMLMKNKREELRQLRLKMLDFSEEAEEKSDIELECRKKIEELRTIFAIADPKNLQRRVNTPQVHSFSWMSTPSPSIFMDVDSKSIHLLVVDH